MCGINVVGAQGPGCVFTLCHTPLKMALLLVTFDLLDVEQSYIPLLKALVSGINAVGAQGCGCMFTLCHTSLKMGLLLHKTEIVCRVMLLTVAIFTLKRFHALKQCEYESE